MSLVPFWRTFRTPAARVGESKAACKGCRHRWRSDRPTLSDIDHNGSQELGSVALGEPEHEELVHLSFRKRVLGKRH